MVKKSFQQKGRKNDFSDQLESSEVKDGKSRLSKAAEHGGVIDGLEETPTAYESSWGKRCRATEEGRPS